MFDHVFERHERVAFQFSGGKDSTAALLLLRPWWSQMTVYWLDSGDAFPETERVVRDVVALGIERFVRVPGKVHQMIHVYGPPSDLVPFGASQAAHHFKVALSEPIQDRAMCCARSKFVPMHQRMLDDGVTLIVRGQKAVDQFKGPHRSGEVVDGIELLFPIENWTDGMVSRYLAAEWPQALAMYQHLDKSGDCMRCSAWLGDARVRYLREHHPEAFVDLAERLRAIAAAVDQPMQRLRQAVSECGQEPAQGD
ncbi:Phosphoadenosine phosphosulfate reductase [Hydrogenophaga intermedia]|uniref:Phosphoadenosine phosphosulfate reductase n=1 Tax=Hydrogenophaga intermedia TaxID=65786 RepID=A0A1L1PHS6_HYDIT|nr:phosphoadenosine phosphosulfate reductase family protein [Hydrogenophaga intermedia]CDN87309.1 Phosphoadenosine phosphosulfate reductase [Hydrogenophaga intermedia]